MLDYIFNLFQIQASNGEVTITNDGATILKQMSVIHPAAKMVIMSITFILTNNMNAKLTLLFFVN